MDKGREVQENVPPPKAADEYNFAFFFSLWFFQTHTHTHTQAILLLKMLWLMLNFFGLLFFTPEYFVAR